MKKKELQEAVSQLFGVDKSRLAGLDREELQKRLQASPAEAGMDLALEKLKPRLQPLLAFSGSLLRRKQLFDVFDAMLVPAEPGANDQHKVAREQVKKLVEEVAEKNVQAADRTATKVGEEAAQIAEMVKARAHSWKKNGDSARARPTRQRTRADRQLGAQLPLTVDRLSRACLSAQSRDRRRLLWARPRHLPPARVQAMRARAQ